MNRARFLRRLVIVLLLLGLLASSELVPALYRRPLSVVALLVSVHLTLLAGAVTGLCLGRTWGFYLVYAAVPFATIMLSISFVPLVGYLLPSGLRWVPLLVLNGAVLLLAALAHRGERHEPRGELV